MVSQSATPSFDISNFLWDCQEYLYSYWCCGTLGYKLEIRVDVRGTFEKSEKNWKETSREKKWEDRLVHVYRVNPAMNQFHWLAINMIQNALIAMQKTLRNKPCFALCLATDAVRRSHVEK